MIAVQDIAYVRYQAPDLDLMEAFLLDFGLQRAARSDEALYMRARGSAHHVHITHRGEARTVGFGLLAGSRDDLERLAAATATRVEPTGEPGGGWRVRLADPGGLRVDVVYGMAAAATLPSREPMPANPIGVRQRANRPVRLEAAPSQVMRIGHVALLVPSFEPAYAFYRDLLGLRLSDGYTAGPGGPRIAAFMHCGLGAQLVDHHTVALVQPPPDAGLAEGRIDHSAFEVVDLDEVMRGHQHLRQAGRMHSWGLGRHVEGSQLFDYWRDPWGHKVEHWTDGDVVNDDYAGTLVPMDPARLAQWAPPFNPEFFR